MLLIPSSLCFQNLRQLLHKSCNLHAFVDSEFYVKGCSTQFSRDAISSVCLVFDFFIYTVIFFIKQIFKTIWSFVILKFKYTHSVTRLIFHKSTCLSYLSYKLDSEHQGKVCVLFILIRVSRLCSQKFIKHINEKSVTRYYVIKTFQKPFRKFQCDTHICYHQNTCLSNLAHSREIRLFLISVRFFQITW